MKEREAVLEFFADWEDKLFHLEIDWTDCTITHEETLQNDFPQNTVGYYFTKSMRQRIIAAVGDEQELLQEALNLGMDYLVG